ncbi:tRNA (adenosine(37)-N6)-threonylcarbamoyltransferase complex ATPase subunit type 1 TsaE [Leptospira kirschneri serovar Pomona]|uniref:tRNA threonylcarbamoyladenosine biosynthesis protein TsaE n=1 Tax=Leptospira kirschneri serovar Pomona TaxID=561005 RepID=A0A1T1DGM7_9LEPT|nr:tRNA (adenosine(37)-N6)-threonylcarbamoyltransferase complex ATPase subunit type 1 TsaE [Leptospira kirschneri]OOV40035.1 tRNA (adenosine(37)-N6)-threonylcarbamoyltransferase complex ATPase subunit type 1 TsaE [Leptospira kirschneri serovar Pomona]
MELEFKNLKLDELDKPAEFLASLILKEDLHPVFLFTGVMGAGKTTFASKLVKKILPNANVNSPTYTLINEYSISKKTDLSLNFQNQNISAKNFISKEKFDQEKIQIHHFDLHRLKSPDELEDLGFEETWGKAGVSIIEWWQVAKEDLDLLPLKIEVEFKIVSEYERTIIIKSTDIENFASLKKLWKKVKGNPI